MSVCRFRWHYRCATVPLDCSTVKKEEEENWRTENGKLFSEVVSNLYVYVLARELECNYKTM